MVEEEASTKINFKMNKLNDLQTMIHKDMKIKVAF